MFGRRSQDPSAPRRALTTQDAASAAVVKSSRCQARAGRGARPGQAGAGGGGAQAFGGVLRRQDHRLQRADRHHRPHPARQARGGGGARGDPRHRQRDHPDQERGDVDRRAGGAARGHLQRRARLRPARAAAGARRHRRHHGQRRGHDLHRGERQGAEDGDALRRQRPAHEHLPAHRQPGRPPRRRVRARSATRASPTAAAST